jgi:hypothetical protein
VSGGGGRSVEPGDSVVFYADYKAYKKSEAATSIDAEKELAGRKNLISGFWNNLVLETNPDPVINTMFSFAKIRGAESHL